MAALTVAYGEFGEAPCLSMMARSRRRLSLVFLLINGYRLEAKEASHAKVAEAITSFPLFLLLPCCQIRKPGYFEVLHAIVV